MPAACLEVDRSGSIHDIHGRTVVLRGINFDAGSKMPVQVSSTYTPVDKKFWDGDNVSFVNRPFGLEEAPEHLERLKLYGFNTIRYIYTWEALEHKGPGIYDDDFISFTIEMLKMIDKYGFYVILDPHQDNVSCQILPV